MSGSSSGDAGWVWAMLVIAGLVLFIAVVQCARFAVGVRPRRRRRRSDSIFALFAWYEWVVRAHAVLGLIGLLGGVFSMPRVLLALVGGLDLLLLPLLLATAHAVYRGLHYGWLRLVLVLGHLVWPVALAEYRYVLRHEVKWAVRVDKRPAGGEPTPAMPAAMPARD